MPVNEQGGKEVDEKNLCELGRIQLFDGSNASAGRVGSLGKRYHQVSREGYVAADPSLHETETFGFLEVTPPPPTHVPQSNRRHCHASMSLNATRLRDPFSELSTPVSGRAFRTQPPTAFILTEK